MNPDGLGDRLPILHGDGLSVRPLVPRDTGALLELFSDPAVLRFMSIAAIRTEREAAAFVASVDRQVSEGTLYQWGIELDGDLVGTCTLAAIDRHHGTADIGFAVTRRLWGRRIMSRSLPIVIRFAFDRLSLNRLGADTDPRNLASIRLLEKSGFQREGLARERYRQYGEVQDAILMALLRRDWRG